MRERTQFASGALQDRRPEWLNGHADLPEPDSWSAAVQARNESFSQQLEGDIQATLGALKEIDQWYDCERATLQSHPSSLRSALAEEIEERHRKNREPYVLHLAQIYQMLNSTRLFQDSSLLSVPLTRH